MKDETVIMLEGKITSNNDGTSDCNGSEETASDDWFFEFAPINAPFACRRLKMFPRFEKQEIILGRTLGQGTYGVVNELSEIFCLPDNERSPSEASRTSLGSCDSLTLKGERSRTMCETQHSDLTADTLLSEYSTHSRSMDCTKPKNAFIGRSFIAKSCKRTDGSKRYALKKVSWALRNAHEGSRQLTFALEDLRTEVYFLAALEHPHIIKLRGLSNGSINRRGFFHIVDCLVTTLEDQIKVWKRREQKTTNQRLSTKVRNLLGKKRNNSISQRNLLKRLKVTCDLSSALAYLHGKSIMHRDLKPDNMGFDVRGDIRLFDFGLARELHSTPTDYSVSPKKFSKQRLYTRCCGSKRYMAPENFFGIPYNESIDIYSFTLVMWEVINLSKPYQGMCLSDLEKLVMKQEARPIILLDSLGMSQEILSSILRSGWAKDSNARPTATQIFTQLQQILSPMSSKTDLKKEARSEGYSHRRRSTLEQDRFL